MQSGDPSDAREEEDWGRRRRSRRADKQQLPPLRVPWKDNLSAASQGDLEGDEKGRRRRRRDNPGAGVLEDGQAGKSKTERDAGHASEEGCDKGARHVPGARPAEVHKRVGGKLEVEDSVVDGRHGTVLSEASDQEELEYSLGKLPLPRARAISKRGGKDGKVGDKERVLGSGENAEGEEGNRVEETEEERKSYSMKNERGVTDGEGQNGHASCVKERDEEGKEKCVEEGKTGEDGEGKRRKEKRQARKGMFGKSKTEEDEKRKEEEGASHGNTEQGRYQSKKKAVSDSLAREHQENNEISNAGQKNDASNQGSEASVDSIIREKVINKLTFWNGRFAALGRHGTGTMCRRAGLGIVIFIVIIVIVSTRACPQFEKETRSDS